MFGIVVKIHSDFYYVKAENQLYECKLREIIKKERKDIWVGDKVEIEEITIENMQAAIVNVLSRKNFIPRPAVANIDQLVIVESVAEPELDFTQLDRYLIQAQIYKIPALICINKDDLEDKENIVNKIKEIYMPLGYKVVFTSALTGDGVEGLLNELVEKKSVFSGPSGVGKSSILNKINPDLALRTKNISAKTQRGTHTTRHAEIIEVIYNGKKAEIIDTPGFSHLKFDNILPKDVGNYFSEIAELSGNCHFSDCLHLEEKGCYLLENFEKISPSRYESYKSFVKEAFGYKEKLATTGYKKESKTKTIDSKQDEKIKIVKLNSRLRESARKTKKQKLNNISTLEDAYYNKDTD